MRKVPTAAESIPASALKFIGPSQLALGAETLQIVDGADVVATFGGWRAPVTMLEHRGAWLAAADASGLVRVFNIDAMKEEAVLPGFPKGVVAAMAIDGCGRLLLLSTHREWRLVPLEGGAERQGAAEVPGRLAGALPLRDGQFLLHGPSFVAKFCPDGDWEAVPLKAGATVVAASLLAPEEFEEVDSASLLALLCLVDPQQVAAMLPAPFERKKYYSAK